MRHCVYHGSLSSDTAESIGGGALAGQDVSGKEILKAMMAYVWPKDDEMIRKRVMLSLGLLISAKVINVGVPFIFKAAVDGAALLSVASAPEAVLATTVSLAIGCKVISRLLFFLIMPYDMFLL